MVSDTVYIESCEDCKHESPRNNEKSPQYGKDLITLSPYTPPSTSIPRQVNITHIYH